MSWDGQNWPPPEDTLSMDIIKFLWDRILKLEQQLKSHTHTIYPIIPPPPPVPYQPPPPPMYTQPPTLVG